MRTRFGIFLTTIAIAGIVFATDNAPVPEIAYGKIVDNIPAGNNTTYALYLPSNYSRDRSWPILYALDARQRGAMVAALFQPAAEKYGYIIASSNNTRSDDPDWPNPEAIQAMWDHTRKMFSIDPQRAYATGFSGGGRLACEMGYVYKGAIAGVIPCGAGFPPYRPATKDVTFGVYGIVGHRDFNHHEMLVLDRTLTSVNVPHRIHVFDGTHEWPSAEICTTAIEWMEILAMKRGLKDRNEQTINEIHANQLEAASAREGSNAFEALMLYRSIVSDFTGLRDVSEAEKRASALADSKVVQKLQKEHEQRFQKNTEFDQKFNGVIKSFYTSPEPPSAKKVIDLLDLKALREKANEAEQDESSIDAYRKLQNVLVTTSFYLPQVFFEKNDYARAKQSLLIAVEAQPDAPGAWFRLARVYAKSNDKKQAVEALNKAVEYGFDSLEQVQSEKDFDSIEEEEAFKSMIEKLKKN